MSRTIHKFRLNDEQNHIALPKNAQVRHIAEQNTDICMWVELDPTAKKETRTFWVVGTGHDIPEPEDSFMLFLGSAVFASGLFVFHVYEETSAVFFGVEEV